MATTQLKRKVDIVTLDSSDSRYPTSLKKHMCDNAPTIITALGDLNILQNKTLALFSSIRCPGNLILKTYDLAQNLRQQSITAIGGFHSPMEKETLTILLRGKQPVVICPARNIGTKIVHEYSQLIEQGRLLILSPFDQAQCRITSETSCARNRFVAALADAVFVVHAETDGNLAELCREVIAWKKKLYSFEGESNAHLIALGAQHLTVDELHHDERIFS